MLQKWGIERVDQVIDILGLMGDSSDNIPGVKGIGPKTAAIILNEAVFPGLEYGGVDLPVRALGGDAVIRLIRVVKLDEPAKDDSHG